MAENKNITESTKYFFKNIIYLNLKGNSEEYKTGVLQRLWTIQWWPLGQKLIEAIVKEAKGTIYNTQLLIYNHHGASDYKEYYRGLPDNGKLYFDLGYYERQPYFDPTQKSVIECGKTYVYLFHELLHFYHNLKHIFNAESARRVPNGRPLRIHERAVLLRERLSKSDSASEEALLHLEPEQREI